MFPGTWGKNLSVTLNVYAYLIKEKRPGEAEKADALLFQTEEDTIALKRLCISYIGYVGSSRQLFRRLCGHT